MNWTFGQFQNRSQRLDITDFTNSCHVQRPAGSYKYNIILVHTGHGFTEYREYILENSSWYIHIYSFLEDVYHDWSISAVVIPNRKRKFSFAPPISERDFGKSLGNSYSEYAPLLREDEEISLETAQRKPTKASQVPTNAPIILHVT
jgi:hypothetical protein